MSTSTRATAPNRFRPKANRLSSAQLAKVAGALRGGGLVIFPTETVYGLAASAFSLASLHRIYELKGRRWRKPLALLVDRLEAAAPLVETIPREAHRLAEAFWPGPLTLLFKASALGRLLTGGLSTIGVRIPDHPIPLQLLKTVRIPLATTSVNRSGDEPAVSGEAAARLFGAHVDWVIDGGTCRVKKASSVVDVSTYPFTMTRAGAIPKAAFEKVLG